MSRGCAMQSVGSIRQPDAASQMIVVDEAEYRSLPAAIAGCPRLRALALGDISGRSSMPGERSRWPLRMMDPAHTGYGVAGYRRGCQRRSTLRRAIAARFPGEHVAGRRSSSALGITFILATIWTAQGRLREAVSAYQRALQLAEHRGAAPLMGTSDLYRGLSELLCAQGDLDRCGPALVDGPATG